jgi:hypothetical protein
MFVRKKKNKSGVVSVQIIDKSSGKYKVIKTIGSSSNEAEINALYLKGKKLILQYNGQQELDFDKPTADEIFNSIKEIKVVGTKLLIGKI